MLQMLVPAVTGLVGDCFKTHKEEKRAKSAVKVARAETEAEVMRVAAIHEAGWEEVIAEASMDSWTDEAWTFSFIAIIAMYFISPMQPYVQNVSSQLENLNSR